VRSVSKNKPGMVVSDYNASYAGGISYVGGSWSEAGPGKKHKTLSDK
jgi:hypothetical protein